MSSAAEASPGLVDVMLDDCGPDRNKVLQAMHDHLHLGLKDSLDLVLKAPCALAQAMEPGNAKSFLAALAKAGAKARGIENA